MAVKRGTDVEQRLAALAGSAPHRSPNVRTLAKYAANSECALAAVGFAAQVDFDRLLMGTRLAAPFGQSPFAFRRGNLFEEKLRENDYAPTLQLLKDHLGYDPAHATVENLRKGFAKNRTGLEARAARTGELVRAISAGAAHAPNLIDGAVLTRDICGVPAYFEADAVAAHFEKPILVGEIKSFPTVDGQADADKVGAAISQVSIYILLLRELVQRVGGDAQLVSGEALLITPLNTGLRPTLTRKAVGREVDRAARILDQAPSAPDIVAALPGKMPSFERVSDRALPESARLAAAEELAEAVGTKYCPSCLSSCGMSRLCRERAHRAGDPARIGGQLVRLLPGVSSLDRAAELTRGARATEGEEPVARELQRAAALVDALQPPSRRAGKRASTRPRVK